MKINFNVNVRRRYFVNGKEYASIGEMPAEIQETFRKAMPAEVREALREALPAEFQETLCGVPPASVSTRPAEGLVEPRATYSPFLLWILVGLMFLLAVSGLYYLINQGGFR